jgi:hypothetical protein
MKTGTMKADIVMVGEFKVSFLGTSVSFSAKAAFASSTTKETHGWTENTNWTPATIQKLRELKEAMETDLANIHLVGGAAGSDDVQRGLTLRDNAPPAGDDEDDGLGGHLGADAPQAR